jgi:hypothetical protein
LAAIGVGGRFRLVSSPVSTKPRSSHSKAELRSGRGDSHVTPDERYFVVRGRLWRRANPSLPPHEHERLVKALMAARRGVAAARRRGDRAAEDAAHAAVEQAKVLLGERGPVWWDDGAPDLNRHLARTGPYAEWFAEHQRQRRDIPNTG